MVAPHGKAARRKEGNRLIRFNIFGEHHFMFCNIRPKANVVGYNLGIIVSKKGARITMIC